MYKTAVELDFVSPFLLTNPGRLKVMDPPLPVCFSSLTLSAKNQVRNEWKGFLHHLLYAFCLYKNNISFMITETTTQKHIPSLNFVLLFI